MLWLARALESAPESPPELPRAIRTSLGGWHAGAKLLERSLRHAGEVHAVAFCPEGRRLATASGDRTARLWDVSTGSALAPPLGHDGPVRHAAFSPDGTAVATASDDGAIRVWDALTGAPVGSPIRADGPVDSLGFSPDGSRIAASGGPGEGFLWEVSTGRPIPGPGPIRALAVAFAPDGSALAVGTDVGVVLLDATTGDPHGDPLAHASAVRVLAFDGEARCLLTGGPDGEARVWDLPRRVAVVSVVLQVGVRRLAFRPRAAFATVSDDGRPPLGNPPRDDRSRVADHVEVDCLAVSPDGATVATGGPDGMVRLWCAGTGLPIGPPLAQGGSVRA